MSASRLSLLLASVLVVLSPFEAAGQDALIGTWSGPLRAGGVELRIVFHLEEAADGLTATMDSPDQGATGIPVSDVTVTGDSLTLAVDRIGGTYRGALSAAGDTLDGTWTQSGQSIPLLLTPATEDETAPPPRPQHPEPPYPYASEEVTFTNDDANLTLAGSLTQPEGEGPHPAVVLLSGSGPQDRNSEVFNHKLFHVLADHLTRQGIAVLRYDERGVGDSGGAFEGATSEDFATDAAAAIRFLQHQPTVNRDAIGLLGMSEGGLVAPLVHTRHEPVAFLVLLAGPAVSGADIIVEQSARIAAAQGASSTAADSIRTVQRRLMVAVRSAPDSAALADRVRPLLSERGTSSKQIDSQLDQLASPWFRFFVQHDPASTLHQVDVPVLALYGSRDLQVPPEQNVSPMRTALGESSSDDTTVRVLDGLNHLFQPAETGLPTEYAQIDTTMAPAALQSVSDWIRSRAKGSRGD